MAMLNEMGVWEDRLTTSKVAVNSIPAEQHPNRFTSARAGLLAIGVLFTLLGTFAIVCRILTIVQRRRKSGYDDHAMFMAYGFAIAFTASVFVSVRWGVGLELQDVPANWGVRAIQAIYADEVFYYITIFCVKLSFMFLYLRVAAELRGWFWYTSVALFVILILHFITTITVVGMQCMPIEKYWKPSTPGKCIDITAFFYSTSIFTIITDVIMITLPIPIIWKIPRERRQKFAILAVLLIAGGGTLASCIRLYSIRIFTNSRQPMRDAAPISTWSFIEINLGILCASAAVIKPIFSKTRAPTPETERGAGRLCSAANPLGMMGTQKSKAQTTVLRDLKDYGCWSQSQASTIVASPSPTKSRFSERYPHHGNKICEITVEEPGSSKRHLEPLPTYDQPPRGRQSSSAHSALPQLPEQPMLHAMVSCERSHDPNRARLSHEEAKLRDAFPQYFSEMLASEVERPAGQSMAGW